MAWTRSNSKHCALRVARAIRRCKRSQQKAALIAQGGVSLDGTRIEDDSAIVQGSLPGGVSVLRRGKKTLAGIFIS